MDCSGMQLGAASSAASLSQLAGLLAGFVFTGIVILISDSRMRALRGRALSLFYAAFTALALDSYIFANLSADIYPSICKRTLASTVVANGLLSLGVLALVAGLGWLLTARDDKTEGDPGAGDLARYARWTAYAIGVISVLLLGFTSAKLLSYIYGGVPPGWTVLLLLYPAGVLGLAAVPYFDAALLRSPDVNLPAYACLAHTVTSIVVFGVLAAVPASWQMTAAVSAILLVLVTPIPAFVLLFRTSSTKLS